MTRETAGGRAPVCGHADEGQTVNLGAKPKQLLLRDYGNTWFTFFEKGDTETLPDVQQYDLNDYADGHGLYSGKSKLGLPEQRREWKHNALRAGIRRVLSSRRKAVAA